LWRDQVRLGAFYAELADELTAFYGTRPDSAALVAGRRRIFGTARAALSSGLDGRLEIYSGAALAERELNNASVLAARMYRERLGLFDRVFEQAGGDLRTAIVRLRDAIDARPNDDPYRVVESLVQAGDS